MSARVLLAPLCGALLLGTTISHAATITLSNTSIVANLDDFIVVDVLMDFTDDATVGGNKLPAVPRAFVLEYKVVFPCPFIRQLPVAPGSVTVV